MSTFPCPDCGGKRWHVESLCGIFRDERIAESMRGHKLREEYKAEQARRLAALAGDVVVKTESGYKLRVHFQSGMILEARLTGQEMDGHFDNSPQSLAVCVITAEEAKAER